MNPQKFRWSRVYESSEEELQTVLEGMAVEAERWTKEEFEQDEPRLVPAGTIIWCAEGSLYIDAMGLSFSLQPGDALKFSSEAWIELRAGISGCACYEAADV